MNQAEQLSSRILLVGPAPVRHASLWQYRTIWVRVYACDGFARLARGLGVDAHAAALKYGFGFLLWGASPRCVGLLFGTCTAWVCSFCTSAPHTEGPQIDLYHSCVVARACMLRPKTRL